MASKIILMKAILSIWFCWFFLVLPRMAVPQILPLIEKDFNLSHGESALLMSVYMFPYALMQLPAGSLSDRFSKKYFIVFSVLGTCLATVFMAFAGSFNSLLAFRILSGLMGGMFYAPSTAYLIQSVAVKDIGAALGFVFTGGSLANISISLFINSLDVEMFGWRNFFLLCAIPGVLFAPLLFFTLKEEKIDSELKQERLNFAIFWTGLKNPQYTLLLVYVFISSLSNWSLATFLPTFFVERGLTIYEASRLMLIYNIITFFAGFLVGPIIKKLGLRKPALISTVTMCLFSYFITLSTSSLTTILLLVLWGLFGGISWSSYNALVSEITPRSFQGAFLGIFNLTAFLSGTVGPIIFGGIADVSGFEAFFMLSFILYVITFGIALLILVFPRFLNRKIWAKS